MFQLVGITGENRGAGFVEISVPSPVPGAGLASFVFLLIAGAATSARQLSAR